MPLLAVVLVAWYVRGVARLGRRGRRWPPARTWAFVGGTAVAVAATFVPDRTFTLHMTEHIALGMVAPLLVALGAPVTLALQSGSAPNRARLRRLLHGRAVSALSHPVVGWLAFGGTLVVLYFTPLLALSERNDWLHALVHLHLVVVGSLFLWPLVGADPVPRRLPFGGRLLAVLVAVPFHAFVGLALISADSPVSTAYRSLSDQRSAAALLWVSGEIMTAVVASIVFRQWLAADRRQGLRLDRQAAI